MAVADLRRALVAFYGLYCAQPLRDRFLVAAHEPLLAPQSEPCGEM